MKVSIAEENKEHVTTIIIQVAIIHLKTIYVQKQSNYINWHWNSKKHYRLFTGILFSTRVNVIKLSFVNFQQP